MGLTQITTGGVDENINIDSNTLKVDGTNNLVGIGTSSPGTKLDILGGSDASVIVTVNGQDASSEYLGLGINAGAAVITAGGNGSTSNALVFKTAPSGTETERMRIDSSGRLLVGTTTEGVSGGDNFTIGATNHAGMTIRSGTSNRGAIYFSDGTSGNAEYRGYIEYDQSADYMRFGTGAAERIRIDSSGMVDFQTGIFGDNPSDNFTLNGRTQPHYGFNLVPETGVPVGFSGYRGIAFATNGSERMRIDSLGNVGVGLTSPASKLHVKGGSLTVEHATPSTGTCQLNINSENNSQVTLTYDDQGSIVFGTASTPATQAGFSEKIRIDSSGRVGIGTDNPGQQLTIKKTGGQTQVSLISDTNESCAIYFGDTASTNRGVVLYDQGQDSLQFSTAGSERMRIDSSGNVLIGTTSVGGSGGTTLRANGLIAAPAVYSVGLSASPRDAFIDQNGEFGYVPSIREAKTNIQVQNNVDWLYQLEPVTFNYKAKDRETGEYTGTAEAELEYGLIAEDVEAACPDLCFYDQTDNGPELRGVSYKKLITPMLKALQDARAEIETLKTKVAALEAG